MPRGIPGSGPYAKKTTATKSPRKTKTTKAAAPKVVKKATKKSAKK